MEIPGGFVCKGEHLPQEIRNAVQLKGVENEK